MKDKDWFKLFDETHNRFHWFFTQYGYELEWEAIHMFRVANMKTDMIRIMNKIWFELPDHRFNIDVNPPGWSEFLNLIEE